MCLGDAFLALRTETFATIKLWDSMASPVRSLNPRMLVWARERSGQAQSDVARAVKKSVAVIEAWERGQQFPTYVQLETLAYRVYKRPIALFFFPEPPEEETPEQSFRTLPDEELRNLLPDTRLLIRKARSLQLSLAELSGGRPTAERLIFTDLAFDRQSDVRKMALQIRGYLGVSLDEQRRWNSNRVALDEWRLRLADVGVYSFKDSFEQEGLSGFCLYDTDFPIVVLNNGNSFSRQIFTLFHELAHVLAKTDGATLDDDTYIGELSGRARAIEIFCNRLASEFLVPDRDFDRRYTSDVFDEAQVEVLARRYRVSREVILRKLLERGIIDSNLYQLKTRLWNEDFRRRPPKTSGGNYYLTQGAYLGQPYLKLAFGEYYRGRISVEQLAQHLHVKVKSVAGLEPVSLKPGSTD